MLSFITTTIFHNKDEDILKVYEGEIKSSFLNHFLFSHRLFYVIVLYI